MGVKSSEGLTTIAGLSREIPLLALPALAPLIHGLSSRPRPRDLPPGVVRGEAAVLVSTCDCSSVKNECLAKPVARGDVLSGMPPLLAGLVCLHQQMQQLLTLRGACYNYVHAQSWRATGLFTLSSFSVADTKLIHVLVA